MKRALGGVGDLSQRALGAARLAEHLGGVAGVCCDRAVPLGRELRVRSLRRWCANVCSMRCARTMRSASFSRCVASSRSVRPGVDEWSRPRPSFPMLRLNGLGAGAGFGGDCRSALGGADGRPINCGGFGAGAGERMRVAMPPVACVSIVPCRRSSVLPSPPAAPAACRRRVLARTTASRRPFGACRWPASGRPRGFARDRAPATSRPA